MRTDESYVKAVHPAASCSTQPVKLHWPGTPDRSAYIVTLAPHLSQAYASGETPEAAWQMAAKRLRVDPRCGSQGLDTDGHCVRCGLKPEPDLDNDQPECPPGFFPAEKEPVR